MNAVDSGSYGADFFHRNNDAAAADIKRLRRLVWQQQHTGGDVHTLAMSLI